VQTLKTLWPSVRPSEGYSPYLHGFNKALVPPLLQYCTGKFSAIYEAKNLAFGIGHVKPALTTSLELVTGTKWSVCTRPQTTRYCSCVPEVGRVLELCDVCLLDDDDDDDDTTWFKCTVLGTFIAPLLFLLIKGTSYISLKQLTTITNGVSAHDTLVINRLKRFKPTILEYLGEDHFPDGNFHFISDLLSGARFTTSTAAPVKLDLVNAPACWSSIFKTQLTNTKRYKLARIVAGATNKQMLLDSVKKTMKTTQQASKLAERTDDFERDVRYSSSKENYDNTLCFYWGAEGAFVLCPYAAEGVDHLQVCLKGRTPLPANKKHTVRNIWAFTKPLILQYD